VSEDLQRFRDIAAKALRTARASSDPWRRTCFEVAAVYKRLALDDEISKGERQRSQARTAPERASRHAAGAEMTLHIPENSSTSSVDGTPATIMGNTMPPRDPDDDDDGRAGGRARTG
jgi:hypothetical protein